MAITESEFVQIGNQSLKCLRQIRGAAYEPTVRSYPVINPIEAIDDAKGVGKVLGDAFVAAMSRHGGRNMTEISSELAEYQIKYGLYPPVTSVPRDSAYDPETFLLMLCRFQSLRGYPKIYQIFQAKQRFLHTDCKKIIPKLNIIDSHLGIVAPLSSDYAEVKLIESYLWRVLGVPSFRVLPLIFSKNLDFYSVMNSNVRDETFAQKVDKIAVWTNIDATGRTRAAVSRIVEDLYPEKDKIGLIPALL